MSTLPRPYPSLGSDTLLAAHTAVSDPLCLSRFQMSFLYPRFSSTIKPHMTKTKIADCAAPDLEVKRCRPSQQLISNLTMRA